MKIIIAYIGIDDIFNISASLQKRKGRFGFYTPLCNTPPANER